MNSYHLTPDGDWWKLTGEGEDRTMATFATKEAALRRCAQLIGERTGSLKIHKADGTIEEERTYPRSADPAKSPG
ncbi:MAG TPA: DUF2188 domain-containing protein [Verrucomicrobiales bacterium]|nr:DUF2188 domain-containing protein [Verrucomicrobiales bacterium]